MNDFSNKKMSRVSSLILGVDSLLSKREGIDKSIYYERLIQIYKNLLNVKDSVFQLTQLIKKYIFLGDYQSLISFLNDYGYNDTVIEALMYSKDVLKETKDKNKKQLIDNIIEHISYDSYIDKDSTDNDISPLLLLVDLSEILYLAGYKDEAYYNLNIILELIDKKNFEKHFLYGDRARLLSHIGDTIDSYDDEYRKSINEKILQIITDKENEVLSDCSNLFVKLYDFQKLINILIADFKDMNSFTNSYDIPHYVKKFIELNEKEKAEKLLDEYRIILENEVKDNTGNLLELAEYYNKIGKHNKEQDIYDKLYDRVISDEAISNDDIRELAEIYHSRGNKDKTVTLLNKVIYRSLKKWEEYPILSIAHKYICYGYTDEALSVLKKLNYIRFKVKGLLSKLFSKNYPTDYNDFTGNFFRWYFRIGEAFIDNGDIERGKLYLDKAFKYLHKAIDKSEQKDMLDVYIIDAKHLSYRAEEAIKLVNTLYDESENPIVLIHIINIKYYLEKGDFNPHFHYSDDIKDKSFRLFMMAYTFIVNYNQPNLTQMREYAEDLYSLYSDKNKEKIYNFIDNLDVDRYIDREIDLNRLIYLINSFKDIILNFLADHLSYIEKLIPILFVSLSLNEYEQAHLTLEQIDKEIKSNPDFDTSDLIDKLEEVCSMFNLYDFAKYKPELNIKNIQVNIEEFKSIYKRIIDICSTIKTNTKLSIEDLELVNTIVLYSTIMIN